MIGNCYDTITFRSIKEKRQMGLIVEEIKEELGLKTVTVRSYLTYEHVIYILEEHSVTTDQFHSLYTKTWWI